MSQEQQPPVDPGVMKAYERHSERQETKRKAKQSEWRAGVIVGALTTYVLLTIWRLMDR
jgi:hypothetical protein